jgi:hypothetical protein
MSWAGALLLILLAAGAIAFAALTGEDGPSKKAPPESETGGEPIAVASATDFDPEISGGDGEEHEDESREAIDGNPNGTGWTTEDYTAGLAGAPKIGVGLILETEEPAAPAELTMTTNGGWTFDVYAAAEGPPEEPPFDAAGEPTNAWGDALAAGEKAEGGSGSYELSNAVENQYFLIWITDLGKQQNAEITDARLIE